MASSGPKWEDYNPGKGPKRPRIFSLEEIRASYKQIKRRIVVVEQKVRDAQEEEDRLVEELDAYEAVMGIYDRVVDLCTVPEDK